MEDDWAVATDSGKDLCPAAHADENNRGIGAAQAAEMRMDDRERQQRIDERHGRRSKTGYEVVPRPQGNTAFRWRSRYYNPT